MAFRLSVSRSVLSSAARVSCRPTSLPIRLPLSAFRHPRRRFFFSYTRNLGELGCTTSLLPLHSVGAAARLTSHLSVNSRAFFELSQGRNGKEDG